MPGFYGYRTVIADMRKHLRGTGKVTSGTLKVRASGDSFTDVTWQYLYVAPEAETTGFGAGGHPDIKVQYITLWRVGETSKPRPDDKIVVGSDTYLINAVDSRLNADESRNFAVYDCMCVRN